MEAVGKDPSLQTFRNNSKPVLDSETAFGRGSILVLFPTGMPTYVILQKPESLIMLFLQMTPFSIFPSIFHISMSGLSFLAQRKIS